MTNVVLVCVAGVSGTFLARRMRVVDPSLEPVVATLSSLATLVPSADVVLIAPQAAADATTIAAVVGSVPNAVLPAAAYTPSGAEAAVRLVRDLLQVAPATYRVSTPTPIKE
ncbi:MAG: hypothetical protein ABWZ77_04105 [Naasia sp.]